MLETGIKVLLLLERVVARLVLGSGAVGDVRVTVWADGKVDWSTPSPPPPAALVRPRRAGCAAAARALSGAPPSAVGCPPCRSLPQHRRPPPPRPTIPALHLPPPPAGTPHPTLDAGLHEPPTPADRPAGQPPAHGAPPAQRCTGGRRDATRKDDASAGRGGGHGGGEPPSHPSASPWPYRRPPRHLPSTHARGNRAGERWPAMGRWCSLRGAAGAPGTAARAAGGAEAPPTIRAVHGACGAAYPTPLAPPDVRAAPPLLQVRRRSSPRPSPPPPPHRAPPPPVPGTTAEAGPRSA